MPKYRVRAWLGDATWEIEANDKEAAIEQACTDLIENRDKIEEIQQLADWTAEEVKEEGDKTDVEN